MLRSVPLTVVKAEKYTYIKVRMTERQITLASFGLVDWVQRCCIESFYALSMDCFNGSITYTTGRLANTTVQGNRSFKVMDQEICQLYYCGLMGVYKVRKCCVRWFYGIWLPCVETGQPDHKTCQGPYQCPFAQCSLTPCRKTTCSLQLSCSHTDWLEATEERRDLKQMY